MVRARRTHLSAAALMLIIAVAVAVVAAAVVAVVVWPREQVPPASQFVARDGDRLVLDGAPFTAAGSNNYRPFFIQPGLVDNIMRTAAENDFRVMRVWGFNDIGLADGTNSVDPQNITTYFHYWDGEKPAYNDGANGLEKLDYVIASAKRHGIKLVIPFVNNWASFGGMDQYVRWADAAYHSDFYTNPTIKQWYRDWVTHLLERTNIHTGLKYKNEPTIAFWELANEARCEAAGQYPVGPDCTTETIASWAREMAAFVKSIDSNHLLGFGDEGFMCDPPGVADTAHFAYDCSTGDARAIAQIEDIDVVGLHLYPDHWGTDPDWATEYLRAHVDLANEVGKPLFLGEYGWRGPSAHRNAVFHQWLTEFHTGGGDIALYWQMQVRSPAFTPADQDGFTAYCPSAVCTQVKYWSQAMASGRTDFPPVSDEDFIVLRAGTTGTADVLANDVSLFDQLDRESVDLDPTGDGIQQSVSVPAGTLTVADGVLTITPEAGYTGQFELAYTVADTQGRLGEVTTVVVRVS